MQADPLYRCWEHIVETYGPGRTIFMSPCGRTFTQAVARELKERYDHLILVCGHYEGVDQRFLDACVDEEISMGDRRGDPRHGGGGRGVPHGARRPAGRGVL